MTAPFVRGDLEQLREWARRLRREATVSVVQHEPRDCAELASLLEGVLSAAPIWVKNTAAPEDLAAGCWVWTHVEQPMPKPGGVPVLPAALESCPSGAMRLEMQRRAAVGLERYGQPLCTNNGRNALQDAREELADAYMYLSQHLLEVTKCGALTSSARSFATASALELVWRAWEETQRAVEFAP